MEARPRLITFGISHFCEKARWVLDWHGIAYKEVSWPPGLHQVLAKRCGAKRTTLPIVLDGETVVQGSGAIIDWADQRTQDYSRRLNAPNAREIEQRADDVIGIYVRRLAYAEMLPRFPHLAKPALFSNTSRSLVCSQICSLCQTIFCSASSTSPELDSRSALDGFVQCLKQKTRRYCRVCAVAHPFALPSFSPGHPAGHDQLGRSYALSVTVVVRPAGGTFGLSEGEMVRMHVDRTLDKETAMLPAPSVSFVSRLSWAMRNVIGHF